MALTVRLLFLFSFDNYFAGDATARLYFSYAWSQTHPLMPVPIWLPLQFYILGTGIQLTGDVLYTPRLITALLASLSVIPLFNISKTLFDKRIAFMASIVFIFFPPHILSSIITLNDAVFIFFLLNAIWWFVKWRRNPAYCSAAVMLIFLNGASLVRFEGWIYTGLLSAFIALSHIEARKKIIPFLFCFVSPFAMMLYSYLSFGDALDGLHHSNIEVSNFYALNEKGLSDSLYPASQGFAHYVWIFALLFFLTQRANVQVRMYAVVVMVPFIAMLYKLATFTILGEMRYFVTPAILLMPFCAAYMQRVKNKLLPFTIALILSGWSFAQIFSFTENTLPSRFPDGFFESAAYTKQYLNPHNSRIFMDQGNWQGHSWAAYSHNMYRGNTEVENGIYAYITGKYWMGELFQVSQFAAELRDKKITHVVLFKDGELQNQLSKVTMTEWRLLKKKIVFEKNGYCIYELLSNKQDYCTQF